MIDDMMIVKVMKKSRSENIENRKRKAMFVSVSPQNAKQAKNPQNAENQELSGQKWPNFLTATRQRLRPCLRPKVVDLLNLQQSLVQVWHFVGLPLFLMQ